MVGSSILWLDGQESDFNHLALRFACRMALRCSPVDEEYHSFRYIVVVGKVKSGKKEDKIIRNMAKYILHWVN